MALFKQPFRGAVSMPLNLFVYCCCWLCSAVCRSGCLRTSGRCNAHLRLGCWCIYWWRTIMNRAKLLDVRILYVFDINHPDVSHISCYSTFPHCTSHLFSHSTIQPASRWVGRWVSLYINHLTLPTGQPAIQSVNLLFSVAVTHLSSQSTVTPVELEQPLSASPCRMISAWATWQQAAGNLSEHRQPDWLIQRHACTHTETQLLVLDKLGVEGRWRCFPAPVSLWLRQRAGREGWGIVLWSENELIPSTWKHSQTGRQRERRDECRSG